VIKELLR